MTGACAKNLQILNKNNGMNPSEETRQKFYNFYKEKKEMSLVDAFVCFHPASMCEIYMAFNRSIIVIASTRYELGRFQADQWKAWNDNLKKIASDPKNLVAANNMYDVEYIRYFTGLRVTLLPSLCKYTNLRFNPSRKEFLIAPIRALAFEPIFINTLRHTLRQHQKDENMIVRVRDIYKHYSYSDLTKHRAIIYVPYQVSTMSLFEQYRMAIPLFFPSLDLLTQWHLDYGVITERSWCNVLHRRKCNGSIIPGVLSDTPDPNDDYSYIAVRHWLKYADFYRWPHIIYYDSLDDLIKKLTSTNFVEVSKNMKLYNKRVQKRLMVKWGNVLQRIKRYSAKFSNIVG